MASETESNCVFYEIAKYPLETNWNGIGDDEYGWRN